MPDKPSESTSGQALNWLTNTVLPKINVFGRKKDTPQNLWEKCPACSQMVFHRELEDSQRVCTHCQHHMRIGPQSRFKYLFDEGAFEIIESPDGAVDPLKFRDTKRYTDRLKESRNRTGDKEAVKIALGTVGGIRTVIVAQNFQFAGGSMGTGAGEAVIKAGETALAEGAPLIAVCASGGMRMQEGILSLMQMPRTTISVQRLRAAGLPFIVVLTDPTTGGVTASFAMLGDITIAEPNALIGFAGPRVIEQTIREQLPEGFQRSEYLLEHGMIDMVVHRKDLRATLIRVIDLLTNAVVPLPTMAEQADVDETPLEGAAESMEEVGTDDDAVERADHQE